MLVRRSQTARAGLPFRSFSGPFFYPDGDGGGGDPPKSDPPKDDPKPTDALASLTPEQRKAFDDAMAAARRDGEKSGKTKAQQEIDAARTKADEDAERERLTKAGEFETVKKDLEGKFAAVSGEKETLAQQVAKAEEVVTPLVEALREELPQEAREDEPKDLPALDALKWLQDRKDLLTKLGALEKPKLPEFPKTPRPTDATREQLVTAEKQRLAQTGRSII